MFRTVQNPYDQNKSSYFDYGGPCNSGRAGFLTRARGILTVWFIQI